MKLVPSRPVTIDKVFYGERWFPRVFRHTDGQLLMYVEYGHDRNFAPDFRLQSHDNGLSWHTPTDNVPRASWCHSFADGELFEIDAYGVHVPKTPDTYAFFGAWSFPGRPTEPVRKDLVRVRAPSVRRMPLPSMVSGYPTFHWWPLWNRLHGTDQLSGAEIGVGSLYFSGGLEVEGRLLAAVHGYPHDESANKCRVFLLESRDRGRTWDELATVARDDSKPEGPDETTLVRLRDGRLYAVMRTGGPLMHAWSDDLGKTWTAPALLRLIDEPDHQPGMAWPVMSQLADGSLVLVYGRPGKHVVIDPSGTGTQWQARLNLHEWELDAQALLGVPPEQRLRGPTHLGVRYWDSGDYLFNVVSGEREVLVGYDVHSYVEYGGAKPYEGVRLVRVRVSA